ncbi:hypothetical protein EVAR_2301_1 [Eumeta japonica]|uniref:Uncharacterized protein n=1 Tax=Eumeta variegata TaxID=151549 RepID=A0A4C1SFT1_EUMVA|nr:hypothetical protein EVAR_2301_1 [Eumeta japonica]
MLKRFEGGVAPKRCWLSHYSPVAVDIFWQPLKPSDMDYKELEVELCLGFADIDLLRITAKTFKFCSALLFNDSPTVARSYSRKSSIHGGSLLTGWPRLGVPSARGTHAAPNRIVTALLNLDFLTDPTTQESQLGLDIYVGVHATSLDSAIDNAGSVLWCTRSKKSSRLHRPLVYKNTMHHENSNAKYQDYAMTVEEFHCSRKPLRPHSYLVYEGGVKGHYQSLEQPVCKVSNLCCSPLKCANVDGNSCCHIVLSRIRI